MSGNPLEHLDPFLEHKVRLGACVLLSGSDAMAFSKLKEALGATDGNLGAQLTKLESSGYLAVEKEFVKRKPITWYSLAPEGRKALEAHLQALQELIDATDL